MMNANRSKLQKAFAGSSNAADSRIAPEPERMLFRKMSRLIWDACGEDRQAETAEDNRTAAPGDAPAAALVQTNQSGSNSHGNQYIALMPVMYRSAVEKRDRE